MITAKESAGSQVSRTLPSLSVSVMNVPADWFPTLTATTPCPFSLKLCAIPDAPVPMKVPPVMTAVVS